MEPIPTWWFVLVIVRREDRYLVVRERKFGQTWYLPAGRVDPGEDVRAAALRETQEETGIAVKLDGLLSVEYRPDATGAARLRFWFLAHPADPAAVPKSEPDDESLEARWVTIAELAELPLRAPEVRQWIELVELELPVAPLHHLRREGDPFINGAEAVRTDQPGELPPHGAAGPLQAAPGGFAQRRGRPAPRGDLLTSQFWGSDRN